MRQSFARATALILVLASIGVFPRDVQAQPAPSQDARHTGLSFTALGLASVQPADDSYVGSPYLDRGLGGAAPGFAVGLTLVTPRLFAAAVEFSTAQLEVNQSGRLVGDRATSRVRDSLFMALAGLAVSSTARTLQIMGGAVWHAGTPRVNDVPINRSYGGGMVDPAALEGAGHFALGGGMDVAQAVGSRVAIVGQFRYALIPRSRRATEIGAGHHIFRTGVGIRVRLTD